MDIIALMDTTRDLKMGLVVLIIELIASLVFLYCCQSLSDLRLFIFLPWDLETDLKGNLFLTVDC